MTFEEFLADNKNEWQLLITPTSDGVTIFGWRCKEKPLPITGPRAKQPGMMGEGKTFLDAWVNWVKNFPSIGNSEGKS